MRRIARFILIPLTLVLLAAALPSSVSADVDQWQRVVRARNASAAFFSTSGCDQVEIYVSAMDGKFVNRHGAVNKQGLLGVLVQVRDACAEPGPKGYPVVFSADGMTLDHLRTTPRFDQAWIDATLPGIDSDGNPVELRVALQWRPTANFERSKVSGHAWFPPGEKRGARVDTFSHNLSAPAVAWGTIWMDGQATTLDATQDAALEEVRYMCKVKQHPQGGADIDC
jgi:hypothetical protein